MRVALLLRGVNVGGVTVRSADLRALLADAGLGDVATVLASGLAAVVADEPHAEDDEHTPYVVFELEPGIAAELAALEPGEGEAIALGDGAGVVHWSNPKGTTLTSPFAKALERTAKDRVTTRNVRTLRKVLAAA